MCDSLTPAEREILVDKVGERAAREIASQIAAKGLLLVIVEKVTEELAKRLAGEVTSGPQSEHWPSSPFAREIMRNAVSYTHLTLPTTERV